MPDRLGTAHWEEQPVVAQRYPFSEGKFWLGRAEDATAIGYRDDRHVCVVSGTRGGKGTSLIINNLCFWPGSAVVVDPKGENATVTAARRGKGAAYCTGMGQVVHVLDPFNVAQVDERYRSHFNPLADLDPNHDETIDEASRLANAIVVIKDEKADPFWDEAARSMVRGIILHVLTAPEFKDEDRNLITVRGLILRGHWQLVETMREMGVYENNPPHELLWQAMERNPAFNGLIAGIGSRFRSMMATAAKTFEGVLQSTDLNTEFLDSPGMRRVLEKSDFKLSELKTRPEGMTLYLSLPQRYMDTHYRWLRMMVALTTTEMEITRGQPASGHPVLMVLDEFAGLKRMSAIENAVAQIAGFGVKLFFVLQSLEQLKFTYKDNWETFLANAGLKVFFSIDDHFTREYISKLAGETEMIRELRSTNESQSENQSYAEGRSQSRTRSQSTTRGTSQSDTKGTSQSFTKGASSSQTSGTSQSVNQSQTEGVNQSRNFSESFGTNESVGWSSGASSGVSYNSDSGTTYSSGSSSSSSGSRGSSHSTTDGRSSGTSSSASKGFTDGTSRSDTRGTSDSATAGTSNSRTSGTSYSDTEGTSDTSGTSQTKTKGTSSSTGTGRSESVHRRPLIQPDEVGRFFARIDDKSQSFYPGLALVMVTGAAPLTVMRTHYFEDPEFINCFSPHPDHTFSPAVPYEVEGIQPLIETLEAAMNGARLTIGYWFIEPGKGTFSNEIATIIDHVPPDNRLVYIWVPYAGKVGRTAKLLSERVFFSVRSYSEKNSDIDPFRELRAACRALEESKKKTKRFRFEERWWALPQIPLILMAVALALARLAQTPNPFFVLAVMLFFAWSLAAFRKSGFGHMLMKWLVFSVGFWIGGASLAAMNADDKVCVVAGLVVGLAVTLSRLPEWFAGKLAATRPARLFSTWPGQARPGQARPGQARPGQAMRGPTAAPGKPDAAFGLIARLARRVSPSVDLP